jgi:hypothetical protein
MADPFPHPETHIFDTGCPRKYHLRNKYFFRMYVSYIESRIFFESQDI